jgi:diguanylate cyclase (GGDEF)-like protein
VRGYCAIIRDITEERRAARSSARQATRIAELYRIAAAAGIAAEEKVATALEAGLTELGAAWAYVARLDDPGGDYLYTAGKKAGQIPAAAAAHVERSRLTAALAGDDVFVVDDPAASPRAFAGAPFSVAGQRYGAVVFVHGNEPAPLSTTDRDYVRALAVLIGSAIQQSERERRLDTLAFGDALTGLPNRALLQDRLEQTLLFARRHRRSFAAHYIDIDHFKTINDTYGHQFGDAVLVAVSGWLRSVLRDSDTIGRMGGDEFVVLQPEIDSQRQAEELAAKLCGIHDRRFDIGGREVVVTISVGCAVFPLDAENPVDMLRAADKALYEVKHRGRNGYAVGTVT